MGGREEPLGFQASHCFSLVCACARVRAHTGSGMLRICGETSTGHQTGPSICPETNETHRLNSAMAHRLFEGREHAATYWKYRIAPSDQLIQQVLDFLGKRVSRGVDCR